jgi:hypothetical protein
MFNDKMIVCSFSLGSQKATRVETILKTHGTLHIKLYLENHILASKILQEREDHLNKVLVPGQDPLFAQTTKKLEYLLLKLTKKMR